MKLCICRNLSDKDFLQHLTSKVDGACCGECALTECCGEGTNCGKCLDMADLMVDAHNMRVEDVREMIAHSLKNPPAKQPVDA